MVTVRLSINYYRPRKEQAMDSPRVLLTVPQVSERLGAPCWAIRRIFDQGLLPPCTRVGRNRVFEEAGLPAIEKALRERGYLK
jgi:hypothetical protein